MRQLSRAALAAVLLFAIAPLALAQSVIHTNTSFGPLNGPRGLWVDPVTHGFCIADTGSRRVFCLGGTNGLPSVIGNGVPPDGIDGEGGNPADDIALPRTDNPTNYPFTSPVAVIADQYGAVYILEQSRHCLLRLGFSDSLFQYALEEVAGTCGSSGPTLLSSPSAVALDFAGNIYIADTGNGRIRKVNYSVGPGLTNFAGGGSSTADGVPATTADLTGIQGVAVDFVNFSNSQNVYIAIGDKIRKISSNGLISTLASGGSLQCPSSLALYGSALWIADPCAQSVFLLDTHTGNLSSVVGTGLSGYSGDGGPAGTAQLNGPMGIAALKYDTLYIADIGNNALRDVSGFPAPQPVMSPATADFGSLTLGFLSRSQSVTLLNNGGVTMQLTGFEVDFSGGMTANLTDPSADNRPRCDFFIVPGGSCTFGIEAGPLQLGPVSAALQFRFDFEEVQAEPLLPFSSTVTANGHAMNATLSESVIDFGTVAAGQTTAARHITLDSGTSGPYDQIEIDITNAVSFDPSIGTVNLTTNCGQFLANGASCGLDVSFTAVNPGSVGGNLQVTFGDSSELDTFLLAEVFVPVPDALISPLSYDFGTVVADTTSAPLSISVQNVGTAPLTIYQIRFTSLDLFTQTNDCPAMLGIGATCTIQVRYQPTSGFPIDSSTSVEVLHNAGYGFNVTRIDVRGHASYATSQGDPAPIALGNTGVVVDFSSVATGGETTLTTTSTGPPVPANFQLGSPVVFYDITTTAVLAPGSTVNVCIPYDPSSFSDGSSLVLLHFESGTWDHPVSNQVSYADPTRICGDVSSLSPFVIVMPSDSTPPVIAPSVVGTLGLNNWYVSDVTLNWSVTDPESAITLTTGCGPATVSSDTSGTTFTCSASSAGGIDSQSMTLKRDATRPTITASVSPAAPAPTGWYNSATGAPTVSFACNDATSGIASCEAPIALSDGGGQAVSGFAQDRAGNSNSASVSGLNVDTVAPTISITTPAAGAAYLLNAQVAVDFSCADSISGVASCTGSAANGASLDTSSVGAKNFSVQARDLASNSATSTRAYTVQYNFVGFLQPVDNLPVVNLVNAGRTIPVKWQLLDAHGAVISSLASLVSLVSAPIACDASPTAILESDSTPTSGAGLHFDATTGVFTYNWPTAKSWSGCRVMQVTLADGTQHFAKFRFN